MPWKRKREMGWGFFQIQEIYFVLCLTKCNPLKINNLLNSIDIVSRFL